MAIFDVYDYQIVVVHCSANQSLAVTSFMSPLVTLIHENRHGESQISGESNRNGSW